MPPKTTTQHKSIEINATTNFESIFYSFKFNKSNPLLPFTY